VRDGDGDGVRDGVGVGEGLGDGVRDGVGEGLGDGVRDGVGEGLGDGVRDGVGEGLGDGDGDIADEGTPATGAAAEPDADGWAETTAADGLCPAAAAAESAGGRTRGAVLPAGPKASMPATRVPAASTRTPPLTAGGMADRDRFFAGMGANLICFR
jgi:hypothetical protein